MVDPYAFHVTLHTRIFLQDTGVLSHLPLAEGSLLSDQSLRGHSDVTSEDFPRYWAEYSHAWLLFKPRYSAVHRYKPVYFAPYHYRARASSCFDFTRQGISLSASFFAEDSIFIPPKLYAKGEHG